MIISVVIPTKDRGTKISVCIESILKQTFLPHEIIIVDSSEKKGLDSMLKRRFPITHPKIKYIYSKVSLTAARNIGVKHSSGDLIFFFDDDVILDKDYIKEVVKVFTNDKDGKIGGVMGQITNVQRIPKDWKDILNLNLSRLFHLPRQGDGKILLSGFPTSVHGKKRTMKVEFLSGCMMAYRRKVFDTFMFDEQLGKLSGYCYMEDVDFSYRVSRKYSLIYTPFAKLEHYPSLGKTKEQEHNSTMSIRMQEMVVNHFYLFKKNMPKHFLNMFTFVLSLLGLLILTLIYKRNPKAFIGWFKGIITIIMSDFHSSIVSP